MWRTAQDLGSRRMTGEQQRTLGERIRDLQEARKINLSTLAREAGVAKGYLWKLCRGEATNPGIELIGRIAAALGVSVTELLGGTEGEASIPDDLPPPLREFAERARDQGTPLTQEDLEMLRGIRSRGRSPQTADDYALLYDVVRRIVE